MPIARHVAPSVTRSSTARSRRSIANGWASRYGGQLPLGMRRESQVVVRLAGARAPRERRSVIDRSIMADHIPSLAHIAAFVMKRGRRRAGVVRGHRRQVEAPREERGFGYFYAPLITAAIRFVDGGLQGDAITEAVHASSHRQRRSYAAVAGGLESSLSRLSPCLSCASQLQPRILHDERHRTATCTTTSAVDVP